VDARGEELVVDFANFVEEIAPGTPPAFTRATGIAVNHDTYESRDRLQRRHPFAAGGHRQGAGIDGLCE
jgi:hypothetical protein